jgi:hypothetical protein
VCNDTSGCRLMSRTLLLSPLIPLLPPPPPLTPSQAYRLLSSVILRLGPGASAILAEPCLPILLLDAQVLLQAMAHPCIQASSQCLDRDYIELTSDRPACAAVGGDHPRRRNPDNHRPGRPAQG